MLFAKKRYQYPLFYEESFAISMLSKGYRLRIGYWYLFFENKRVVIFFFVCEAFSVPSFPSLRIPNKGYKKRYVLFTTFEPFYV